MGILTPNDMMRSTAAVGAEQSPALEITMLSQGLRIRTGAQPDDLCLIEELSIGDTVWDISAGRPVDIDAMACATLDGEHLADMGLRPMPVYADTGLGFLAVTSPRMGERDSQRPVTTGGPRVFFRIWPDSRLIAEIEGRPVLIRSN